MKIRNERVNRHSRISKGYHIMATNKKAELSPTALEIKALLETAEKPLTLKEIKETVPNANPAHLTALRARDLVNADEVEVMVTSKSKSFGLTQSSRTKGESPFFLLSGGCLPCRQLLK